MNKSKGLKIGLLSIIAITCYIAINSFYVATISNTPHITNELRINEYNEIAATVISGTCSCKTMNDTVTITVNCKAHSLKNQADCESYCTNTRNGNFNVSSCKTIDESNTQTPTTNKKCYICKVQPSYEYTQYSWTTSPDPLRCIETNKYTTEATCLAANAPGNNDDTNQDGSEGDEEEGTGTESELETESLDALISPISDDSCTGILGSFKEVLEEIFKVIRIIGVAAALIFGFIDFGKALVSKEATAIKTATSTLIKRLVAAVLIFFLPFILNVLLGLVDGMGTVCIGTWVKLWLI